jgi:5-formyltetrahydrofolate cyclo-ligase
MTSEIVATAKPGLEGKPDASDKARLRAAALARRDALEPSARHHHSAALAQNAASLDWPRGPVSGFWPMRSEVDPRPLMRLLAGRGMPLALPRVERHGLSFRSFTFEDTLMRAGFGLSEPLPHAPEVRPAAMIVPLAAFDRRGHRIGYGAGYYDRAIARALSDGQPLLTVGVAFSVQEIPLIPDEPHDRPLDWIVTECEIIPTSGIAQIPHSSEQSRP